MWVLVIMYVLLIPCTVVYIRAKHRLGGSVPLTVSLKAACTTIIVLAAVAGLTETRASMHIYAILMAGGLVLGLVGDGVICLPEPRGLPVSGGLSELGGFLFGMIYFALGHLCYIGAFLRISTHPLWALPVFLVIYGMFLAVITRQAKKFSNMLIPTAIYGAIIATMLSLSATAPFSNPKGYILPVAAVLFAVSDGLLAYNTFGGANDTNETSFLRHCSAVFQQMHNTSRPLDWISLCCYFAGQSLFAVSIFCL